MNRKSKMFAKHGLRAGTSSTTTGRHKGLLIAAMALLSATAISALAPSPSGKGAEKLGTTAPDYYIPGTTTKPQLDSALRRVDDKPEAPIQVATRAYGDSITLRWAVGEWPDWRYLTLTGVDVLRHEEGTQGFELDTLARCLKPFSLDEFRVHYPDTTDALAYLAMGSLYGAGELTPQETSYDSKTIAAMSEVGEDQKMRVIGANIAAERRPDLANALALRFTDRNVRRGATYSYFIVPSIPDTSGRVFITNGIAENVKNERFKPQAYDVDLRDSISGHCKATLSWSDPHNGFFEIYRRPVGGQALLSSDKPKEWTKVNKQPYFPPFDFSIKDQSIIYEDNVPLIGDYEYRVQAHDAFGDMTEMSPIHRVHYPDLEPPYGAEISYIEITRPDTTDPAAKIYADIHFHKNTFEPDFTHMTALYYTERDESKTWRLLSKKYILPTDTIVRVDVTDIPSSMVTIAACDTAGNMGYGMPKYMHISDMRPPVAPTNLRADADIDGTILLHWDMPDTTDVRYYELFFANAPYHPFTRLNQGYLYDRAYMDTVANNIDQRYIYYFVRAVDWNNNQGYSSDTLRVLRPNIMKPSRAHLDSMWVDNEQIHIRWIGGGDQLISHYVVFKRKRGENEWKQFGTVDGDTVRMHDYKFQIDDTPEQKNEIYQYAVETVSFWDVSSGLTPIINARVEREKYVGFPLKLEGIYDDRRHETRLAWNAQPPKDKGTFYYCVYRKTPGMDGFAYVTDVAPNEFVYTDMILEPGESAEYYISVRFDDGRRGPQSNTVIITRPAVAQQ